MVTCLFHSTLFLISICGILVSYIYLILRIDLIVITAMIILHFHLQPQFKIWIISYILHISVITVYPLLSTHYLLSSTHYLLSSTLYAVWSTQAVPATLCTLPSMLNDLSSTHYLLSSTLYTLPSTIYSLSTTCNSLHSMLFTVRSTI